MPQPPQKKGPNGCVIALIIVGVIFVLGFGGVIAAVAFTAHQASGFISSANATLTADTGTVNADLTPAGGGTTPAPTTGTGSGVPSSSQIDPNAEANVSNAQTSSTVDSNYKPTNVTSSFTTSDTIYVTYTLSGKAGYIMEKTYDSTGTIVLQSQNPHSIPSGDSNGYISFSITSSGSYTTGLYWCQKSDCSDAGLAQVVTFTVS
jgi:cytoskeletal protein RodZ